MTEELLATIEQLKEENETLKDNVEFLHSCLDDRDKSIAIMQEENRTLREKLSEITMVADDEKQSIEHILELEEENKTLKKENEELKDAMKELNNYNKFLIQENERQKSKTITVTDEDNRIILEKGEDGRRHSYGGNVVLC